MISALLGAKLNMSIDNTEGLKVELLVSQSASEVAADDVWSTKVTKPDSSIQDDVIALADASSLYG